MIRLIRAEWTKFRSVPSSAITVFVALALTALLGALGASGSTSDANKGWDVPAGPDGKPVLDRFHFVHQPLAGDGTVTARVVDIRGQGEPSPAWAKAGLIVKESLRPGSRYAAVMLTPGHGVRLQSDFTKDVAGSAASGTRWLRLTRTGTTVTGYESADGATWQRIGSYPLASLPSTVEIGLFVASPEAFRTERSLTGASVGGFSTVSTARFDNVRLEPALAGGEWANDDVGEADGDATIEDGTVAITGTGDVVPRPPDGDVTRLSLTGVFVGLIALIALAVLFMTSEYRRGLIRTTFAANPRRGRVLAAKAIVIGAAVFVVGLLASLASFLIAQPILRSNGYGPPAYPQPSLTDPLVVRAIVGTAVVLALLAVFSLSVGTILRRSAGAITIVILLVVAPQLLVGALPVPAATWMMRLTPGAGFSIQQTIPRYSHVESICLPEDGCFLANPWTGLWVVGGYAAVGLALAYWLLRKRDA
jgi:hypothetical protein